MDFTLKTYQKLLEKFLSKKYQFLPFALYIEQQLNNSTTQQFNNSTTQQFNNSTIQQQIILRHDVDRLPRNALQTAKIEYELGIKGTYYFRIVPESYNLKIMQQISEFGHEIGYHYEDVDLIIKRNSAIRKQIKHTTCHSSLVTRHSSPVTRHPSLVTRHSSPVTRHSPLVTRHLIDAAYESFCRNLEMLRRSFDIRTICMHGSPLSRWDNRLLWKYYDYRNSGIIGEPYFDTDFNKVLYLTDTGRCWGGESVSLRDKAAGDRRQAAGENSYEDWKVKPVKYRNNINYFEPGTLNPEPGSEESAPSYKFHSTLNLIKMVREGRLPDSIMITFHPQRWTDKPLAWVKELVWQNVKNVAKYFLVSKSEK